jgi:hypothetical protein
MIRDERINGVRRRIAARGFGIWYMLLLISQSRTHRPAPQESLFRAPGIIGRSEP